MYCNRILKLTPEFEILLHHLHDKLQLVKDKSQECGTANSESVGHAEVMKWPAVECRLWYSFITLK
jgi:hypothetical protein